MAVKGVDVGSGTAGNTGLLAPEKKADTGSGSAGNTKSLLAGKKPGVGSGFAQPVPNTAAQKAAEKAAEKAGFSIKKIAPTAGAVKPRIDPAQTLSFLADKTYDAGAIKTVSLLVDNSGSRQTLSFLADATLDPGSRRSLSLLADKAKPRIKVGSF